MILRRNFTVGREIELEAEIEQLKAQIKTYKNVIREYRQRDLENNPTPPPTKTAI